MVLGIISGIVQLVRFRSICQKHIEGSDQTQFGFLVVWLLLQVIAISGQIAAGASWSIFFLFATAFNICLVLFLCFKGYGYKKYGWLEIFCVLSAIGAIIIWKITDDPGMAILLTVVADFIGLMPTAVKTWKEPFSESAVACLLVIAAGLAMASTEKIDVANLLYPAYW